MTTGRKLAIGAVVVAGVTASMAYLGGSASWQYYVTADECVASADSLVGTRLRVSGKIVPGTLQVTADRRQAVFSLTTAEAKLPVACSGPLPDNLAEGIEVVVEGRLEHPGLLRGNKVLTRCSSKYESNPAPVSSASTAFRERGGLR
jgi:cytochrome c-type biogenesis protein CcmE